MLILCHYVYMIWDSDLAQIFFRRDAQFSNTFASFWAVWRFNCSLSSKTSNIVYSRPQSNTKIIRIAHIIGLSLSHFHHDIYIIQCKLAIDKSRCFNYILYNFNLTSWKFNCLLIRALFTWYIFAQKKTSKVEKLKKYCSLITVTRCLIILNQQNIKRDH